MKNQTLCQEELHYITQRNAKRKYPSNHYYIEIESPILTLKHFGQLKPNQFK